MQLLVHHFDTIVHFQVVCGVFPLQHKFQLIVVFVYYQTVCDVFPFQDNILLMIVILVSHQEVSDISSVQCNHLGDNCGIILDYQEVCGIFFPNTSSF